jgi:rubrerythrin
MPDTILTASAASIRAASTFYFAEHLGGLFYRQFSATLDNADVRESFVHFAGDEFDHAGWYAEWLRARGHALPSIEGISGFLAPVLRTFMMPLPLDVKLRVFAKTEALATNHLLQLAPRIRDEELRSIVEKTIPFERAHSLWYEKEGRKMLRQKDRKVR